MQGRIKEFFSRDRKTLYMILSIVLISIFSLTIVYAALSVTLNIQGSAKVSSANWDIHLDNIKVTSGSVSGTEPSITSPTTATFSTTLNMPGDFYEFTVDVVNDGSIDAMIDSVIKEPTLTTNQAKYLNYIIEYQNGESINTKQLVSKNSFVRLKVRVEFRKDVIASDLPTTSETLNLAFTVNYVQNDGSGSSVADDGKKYFVVPDGGTYMMAINYEEDEYVEYGSGEKLPYGYTVSMGDAYTDGEYVYIYFGEVEIGVDGWQLLSVVDKTKESYSDIPDYVFEMPVVWMDSTFADCTNLKASPKLPSTLYALTSVFQDCDSLTDSGMPVLPDGIVHISYSFMGCDNLVDLSNFYIPNSVINMWQTFEGCKSLKKAPKLSNNLQILNSTFSGCSSLEKIPTIPNSVEEMESAFSGCSSVSGEIVVNANPSRYGSCFRNIDMSKIVLSGTSTIKQELANTGINGSQVTIIE